MTEDREKLVDELRGCAIIAGERYPIYSQAADLIEAQAAEIAALRATVQRVRAAVDYQAPMPRDELDARIAADVGKLSLRAMAKKHGVKVGRVRGALARLRSLP